MDRCKMAFFTIVLSCFVASAAIAAVNKLMSIQVKKGHLRSTPSFLGKIVAALDYGDRVAVLEKKEPWMKVQSSEKNSVGWLHDSALTAKKIVLKPGEADVKQAASSNELALAGKGFNQQVEGEFKAKNPNMDYTWINKMERWVVPQAQIEQFIKEGKLYPKGTVK